MTTQRPYLLHDTVYQNTDLSAENTGIRPDEGEDGCLAGTMWAFAEKSVCPFPEQRGTKKVSFISTLVFDPAFVIIDETLSTWI